MGQRTVRFREYFEGLSALVELPAVAARQRAQPLRTLEHFTCDDFQRLRLSAAQQHRGHAAMIASGLPAL